MARKKLYKSAADRQKAYRVRKGQKARTILKGIFISRPHQDTTPMGLMTSWNVRLPNDHYVNVTTYSDEDAQIVEQFFKESKIRRESFKARWKHLLKK
jgi:hypothetical protein